MELNKLIFPSPKCSYTRESKNIIWIQSNAVNTPIYHHQNIQNKQQQENNENKQSMSRGLFSSCMGNISNKVEEIELFQLKKQVINKSNKSLQEDSAIDLKSNKHEISCLSENKQTPKLKNDFLIDITSNKTNTQFEYKDEEEQQAKLQTVGEEKYKQEEKCDQFHSPIRSTKKHHSCQEMYLSSPLRKAAEFGPQLQNAISSYIPCLYLPYHEGSDKLLIYFHGNAEDLGHGYEFVSTLRQQLHLNILAVEYPGYGIYKGSPNSDQILQDADSVYEFVRTHLNVQSQNIIIFGRSIGSGPASYLAGTRSIGKYVIQKGYLQKIKYYQLFMLSLNIQIYQNYNEQIIGGLILMSPYTSIRNIVKNIAGTLFQYLVAERFRNIDYIKNSKCCTLFIHGKLDKLIPYSHSLDLMECIKERSLIHLSQNMTHNKFNLISDIIAPIQDFFNQAHIIVKQQKIIIPTLFYSHPNDQKKQISQNISVASINAKKM